MSGTFLGLELGRRGIQVHQKALEITGHNLANAGTEGYSRQEAVQVSTTPYSQPDANSTSGPGQIGTGVRTDMIRRIRDQYLDPQVRAANRDRYYWEDQVSIFSRVEACFAEPAASGIQDQLIEFFKGWQSLNNSPQDPAVKASVKEMGSQLASLMTYTYNQLGELQESVMKPGTATAVSGGQLKDQVDKINDLLKQVNNLTEDIKKIYRIGQQPNDLLDRRDMLLDELARYGPLTVTNGSTDGKPNGELAINFLGVNIGANPLFSLRINDEAGTDNYGHLEIHELTAGKVFDLTAQRENTQFGGSLLGLERARQSIIEFKDMLNNMAVNIKDKIMGKNNTPPPAATLDFFTGSLVTGDFKVNAAIVSDPGVMEGSKASQIAGIRQEIMGDFRNYTLEEYYGMLITEVGNKVKGADEMAANQQAIQEQIYNLRESGSGVSVDEELTRMIQFQYGFQASARIISMMDEMLDEIINRMMM